MLSRLIQCLFAVVLAFAALPAQAQLMQSYVDDNWVTFEMQFAGSDPRYVRLYLDTDSLATTGYQTNSTGADMLMENGRLYAYAGTGKDWKWTYLKDVAFSSATGRASFSFSRVDFGAATSVTMFSQVEAPLSNSSIAVMTLPAAAADVALGNVGITYTASTADIANPERGWFHFPGECDSTAFNPKVLKNYRTEENISIVMCNFYLRSFVDAPISAAALNFFHAQMAAVRSAGLKAVVRFAYTDSAAGGDANASMIQTHLDQLAPYFTANSDVIMVVQAGFVGGWGEWYYTQNFGNNGKLNATDLANRKIIVDKLLSVVPSTRFVQLRTPAIKRAMQGAGALLDAEGHGGTARARLGHHNDCFLASNNDQGTYSNTATEYPYLAAETKYTPMGGETCEPSPRSDCATALAEMSKFHWSYLSADYHPEVISGLASCSTQIGQQLGYRIALQGASFSDTVKPNGTLQLSLKLVNTGWAAPFHARKVDLILRHSVTGAAFRFTLNTDVRFWLPGKTISLTQQIRLPNTITKGNYALLLALPDAAPTLASRPEYAIQLANADTWEAKTGFNDLKHTISVAP